MIKRSSLTFLKAWVGCPVSNNIWLKTELDQAIPLYIAPSPTPGEDPASPDVV